MGFWDTFYTLTSNELSSTPWLSDTGLPHPWTMFTSSLTVEQIIECLRGEGGCCVYYLGEGDYDKHMSKNHRYKNYKIDKNKYKNV